MENIVVLEWTFTPPDYFESPLQITGDNYEMVIDAGKVEARIPPEVYASTADMRDQLHNALNDRFRGVQVLTHRPYQLSKASMYRLHPDGRKDVTIFAETGRITVHGYPVDIILKDKDGNVISDTRGERIATKQRFSELAEVHGRNDPLVPGLLESYAAAVNDPEDELVHLYEIRDALARHFGGEHEARNALSVSHRKWSRLGQLANAEPIEQGRHRGQNTGALRPATKDELTESREIARELIESYLEYLDNQASGTP